MIFDNLEDQMMCEVLGALFAAAIAGVLALAVLVGIGINRFGRWRRRCPLPRARVHR